jgi:hypothetical protein
MTYFELIHEPTKNSLADFDTFDEATAYVRDVLLEPNLDGLRLLRVTPGLPKEVMASGSALLGTETNVVTSTGQPQRFTRIFVEGNIGQGLRVTVIGLAGNIQGNHRTSGTATRLEKVAV